MTLKATSAKDREVASRRDVLSSGAAAVTGLLAVGGPAELEAESSSTPSVYERLGVKHVINAAGTLTTLGGSLMTPEVAEAWLDASRHFVDLADLQNKVGQRIAELAGVEAALVTTGAAGAMQLATAAAITRGAPDLVRRLPDTAAGSVIKPPLPAPPHASVGGTGCP